MRRLILMRHAKSAWDDPRLADFDRPLNARGREGAAAVGAWLAARGLAPELGLVSAAARTRETWARLGPVAAAAPARFVDALYHAGPEVMLRALRGAGAAETVLLLGHQPGIGAMAERLLAAPAEDSAYARYPTAATAVIGFPAADWAEIGWLSGRLEAFVTPRALAAGEDD